ncbi:MAG: hypothetical protein AAGG08_05830 [Actinomycetota bacterium]
MTVGFDRVIAVDGSAAATPKRGADSIWISIDDGGELADPVNPATRSAAFALLEDVCARPGRTLLTVDWSLGYPAGSAVAFGLDHQVRDQFGDRFSGESVRGDAPWAAMWGFLAARVVDAADNANNRFEVAAALNERVGPPGPFWGAPASASNAALSTGKQPFEAVAEWRRAEVVLRRRRQWPKSCWQLAGAGAVGSQSLLGIARLARLRSALASTRTVAVWPFETGLAAPDADIDVVIAEMWPTLFVSSVDLPAHWIRDAAQVDAVVRLVRNAERSGELGTWFRPDLTVFDDDADDDAGVDADDDAGVDAVVAEEGWILGLI